MTPHRRMAVLLAGLTLSLTLPAQASANPLVRLASARARALDTSAQSALRTALIAGEVLRADKNVPAPLPTQSGMSCQAVAKLADMGLPNSGWDKNLKDCRVRLDQASSYAYAISLTGHVYRYDGTRVVAVQPDHQPPTRW